LIGFFGLMMLVCLGWIGSWIGFGLDWLVFGWLIGWFWFGLFGIGLVGVFFVCVIS